MARSTEIDRLLDRILGIPLIALLGLLHRKRPMPESPRRIGVIQPTAIGDMFLMSGLLVHLHRLYPAALIHFFHGPTNAAAIELMPVDVIPHCCVFRRPLATIATLRACRLDILIDCAPWTRLTAIETVLSGARATVGFQSTGQHIHHAFDFAAPYQDGRHEIDNHHALAALFGPLPHYRMALRRVERRPPFALPYAKLVLLHVTAGGSRAPQRSWPPDYWAELARRLVDGGWSVAFTGAAADRDATEPIVAMAGLPADRCRSLAGMLDLPELASVLIQSRLLITVDTGVAHLAAALDCVAIGLHGPSRFARWGPSNAKSTGLDAPHPAAGYGHFGFERHEDADAIMRTLTVDVVFAAALAKLAEADPASAAGT